MKLTKGTGMSREDIQTILESDMPGEGQQELAEAEQLLDSLSPEQQEMAAQSSYAYWLATLSDKPPTDEDRRRMAIREARRYISYNDDAEKYLKSGCNFRKEHRIDIIRTCFMDGVEYDSEEDSREAERVRDMIRRELAKQEAFVRGTDKEGRAIAIVRSRTEVPDSDEEFIVTQIYNVERAIASSEYGSMGTQEMICVVFDFASFHHNVAPTIAAAKELISVFEASYSDRLKTLIISEPPLWMRTVWGVLKPLLHPDTREKLVMVHGKDKAEDVGKFIDEEQAMPFLIPSGKLLEEVSVDRFAEKIPFFSAYDDVNDHEDVHDDKPVGQLPVVDVQVQEASDTHISGTF